MPAKWQRVRIDIPDEYKPIDRERIADLVIEHIVERTQKLRVDKSGKAFPKYSESYIKSLYFKIVGKQKSKIDLTLSGDMLAELKLLSHKHGEILIGFEKGSEENARADGNIRGTYGKQFENIRKKRDFLGIQTKELKRLMNIYERQE